MLMLSFLCKLVHGLHITCAFRGVRVKSFLDDFYMTQCKCNSTRCCFYKIRAKKFSF